ncbi:MAG: amino acid ABC transporter/signal transduction system protein [Rheinheimera sp.]|uniref:substrate-binding periplasmic protein n=1 Tax=Arsukibacterium sp. UBA3155 TaxID=1946058 RepID=UPI000C90B23F|nr:transporter substrate-binding domain-containing protein [Arsukibacterium sp. UBA3155]MAD77362.1 amino acid ABC transporter/signal transduction system protein [Rheinheimera sp.]
MRLNWILVLLLLATQGVLAAAPLTVLVGQQKPPYINTANISGYEVELLAEVVSRMGYEPVFLFVPNARIKPLLLQGEGDIASLQPVSNEEAGLFYSNPYIRYQNIAVSLAKDKLVISHSSDLGRYSVLAFQNASLVLGPDYTDMVKISANYRETVDQQAQLTMLLSQRVQVVVMDRNIYNYYRLQHDDAEAMAMHPLFNTTVYRAAFRDANVQRAFDRALLSVILDSWYQRLQRKYFGEENQSLPHSLLCTDS